MLDGMLGVWKPKGMTSHDVVFKLRKILKMKKIGHTGTLDPDVEGVLVVCLGKATRLVELLMDSPKVYRGEVTLGYSTETEDAQGEIVEVKKVPSPIANNVIDATMERFLGEIQQIPPMYSAVKVNGRKLYEYAREGIEVERPVRSTMIYSFNRISEPLFNDESATQSWEFDVHCGKGTYVRTLAVDLGKALGYPAHMSNLVRLETSGFKSNQTHTLEEIQALADQEAVSSIVRSIEDSLSDLPRIDLTEVQYDKVKNGQVLEKSFILEGMNDLTAFFYNDKIIAIYKEHPEKEGLIKPFKMFT